MQMRKIYLVWCQPYDDCAQNIRIFATKEEAEEYHYKAWREMIENGICAIMEMTEAVIVINGNTPFDNDELNCK